MVAIAGNKREFIYEAVKNMYTAVATRPETEFHFPTGRAACSFVGYLEADLEGIPEAVIESFAGVGYPFSCGAVRAGDHVLDLGSGSGTDTLIAARIAGATGKVYSLDMTEAMREKLRANVERLGLTNVEILAGTAEAIPLPDHSVDVVTSNGVLNLVPDKTAAVREIFRVLRPGGRIQIADIALGKPISRQARQDPKLWAECIVGAVEEEQYLKMLADAGFTNPAVIGELDYFAAARNEETRLMAGHFRAHAVTLRAEKPASLATAERLSPPRAPGRLSELARHTGGIVGAAVAAAACFGQPLVLSTLTALGAKALTRHAVLFPVFVTFIALTLWSLYRSGRPRQHLLPFWMGVAAGVSAAVMLWLMATGLLPAPWWVLYAALGALAGASLWEFIERRREPCLDAVLHDDARASLKVLGDRPLANGVALSIAAAAAFYGLYRSVDAYAPKANDARIACFGINACKGQTSCVTAWNACPGLNSCKGRGFLYAAPRECDERGGVPLAGSAADPERT